MKEKIKKIHIVFDIEIYFESQIFAFVDNSLLHQFTKYNTVFFLNIDWYLVAKVFLKTLYPSPGNLTTEITLDTSFMFLVINHCNKQISDEK